MSKKLQPVLLLAGAFMVLAIWRNPATAAQDFGSLLGNIGKPGSGVNLERSLRVGDRLGGHLVSGHIDGTGTLLKRRDEDEWSFVTFRASTLLMRQVVSKGSIAVDGVSLTVVTAEADRFSVALIPHTLAHTTLGELEVGGIVNLETDLLAKYVERQLESRRPEPSLLPAFG